MLFRRKWHRKYYLFYLFIVCSIFITLLRILVTLDYRLYFKVYWTTEALYALLALLALHEAFYCVFYLDFKTWPNFWMIFPGAVLLLSVLFIGNALLHPPREPAWIVVVILSFVTVVNCVLACLFLMFLALAWLLLGESWPTYPYGVVLGFAISTAGSLLTLWLRSIFGTKLNWISNYGPPLSYILAVLVWIASCYLPSEPKDRWRNLQDNDPKQAVATVRQYTKALRRITGRER